MRYPSCYALSLTPSAPLGWACAWIGVQLEYAGEPQFAPPVERTGGPAAAFLHRHDDAVRDGDRATKARLRRHHLGIGEAQRDARFRRRLSIQKLFLQHHITRSASRHTVFTKGCPSTTATRTRSARSPGAMRPRSGRRSEERRVGKEWVSTCRSRGSPNN